ncbi:MAG: DnaJ domain-containing protein [Candidatus Latescibacteria bacterium]|nr:DnaJ domain-containing protein [Candidatus Latescibacterota bacterium]
MEDYYTVLQLSPTSSEEDIKKKFFSLVKLYHPDRNDDTLADDRKFKLINEAYSVLGNPVKRREYDESRRSSKRRSGSGAAASQNVHEQKVKTATLAYRQGKKAIKAKNYEQAAILLKSAVDNDPSVASYHSWYGYVLALLNNDLHEARDECRKAVQMEFYNPVFESHLGYVYYKAGLKSQARKHFENALKWDSANNLALRYISRIDRKGNEDRGEGPFDKIASFFRKIT